MELSIRLKKGGNILAAEITIKEVNAYSAITPEIYAEAEKTKLNDQIPSSLYTKFNVKRGLRDLNGKGVLAGLTNVAEVRAKKLVDGEELPDYGRLFYRGYEIHNLIDGYKKENRFGFEEIAYLLLFGELPNKEELKLFEDQLIFYRSLPKNFVRDVVMKAPGSDMMNVMMRSLLTLHPYDDMANNISLPNVLRQSMQLISLFPMIAIYGYQAYRHYELNDSLVIHKPLQKGSIAENILHLLRPDKEYSDIEAKALDTALVLHMDHGGGNNSAFTTHVVTSTQTDTYSAIAAALASLKGPRHGGANLKVVEMFEDLKKHVTNWEDEGAISDYLNSLLEGNAFDRQGLIYGVGHAVYSKSDPRAEIFHSYVEELAKYEGLLEEFALYERVARLAPEIIGEHRKMYKGVCVNVDFYSGFAYSMLGLPKELYTPLFAMARIVGWSAHRIEELANNGKIIRPAYKSIAPENTYIPMDER